MAQDLSKSVSMVFRSPGKPLIKLFHFFYLEMPFFSKSIFLYNCLLNCLLDCLLDCLLYCLLCCLLHCLLALIGSYWGRCAVHTLVCSYAGVSGHPVLTHAVPPQQLQICSVKTLKPLHIVSVQSLKRGQHLILTLVQYSSKRGG